MLEKGKPTFAYAFSHYPQSKWSIQSPTALAAGKHNITVNFDYAGGGKVKAAKVTLLVDGKKAAKGDIPKTVPSSFSADETLDVGEDFGTPVNRSYDFPFTFQGERQVPVLNRKTSTGFECTFLQHKKQGFLAALSPDSNEILLCRGSA